MTYIFFFLALALGMLFIIIDMVRKNKLQVKYSIFWLVFGVLIIGLSAKPSVIDILAGQLNIDYAPSLLFLLSIIFIMIYIIHLTSVISMQSDRIIRLTQELSILKSKVELSDTNFNKGEMEK